MKDIKFILLKGISNFKAIHSSLVEKGATVVVVKPDMPAIINATRGGGCVIISLSFDNFVLEMARNVDCLVVSWLSDKITVANADFTGIDKSRYYVFSLDPKDVKDFINRGVKAWLLPSSSGLDGDAPLKLQGDDAEKYSSDISFVGQSITVKHNPHLQFLLNFSNLSRHLNGVIEKQVDDFSSNTLKEAYDSGELNSFSLQYMLDYIHMLDIRDLDFALGCEASSRLRKRLVSKLDGFDVRVYGDSHWESVRNGTIKVHKEISYRKETPKVYSRSKINLNITKTFFEGTIQRVYDIIYCGGFCLTDYREDIENRFEPGKEIETYRNENELVDKARYYLEHDNEREDIREGGYRRLQKEHRVGHRVDQVMQIIGSALT
ncbi:hypothetical protein MNBD_NITROSPINAE02-576 [hydrothermal vent metagenome]|uniref:Spore protein YkvP/CgeB glycosyl transferase-like domain-containing protein n=1 Tax=hydrothermal vent metagenome TaxID=652676 RepID=A0A3B1D1U6_9ZZZZ